MIKTKSLHICGTGSGVGKSIIVAALCRFFMQKGYKVCPFKAQNMALNSFITKTGGEIGRAQAVQAHAAKINPTVDMNPVLIKPTSDVGAQIIVRGKPIGNMTALTYINYKKNLIKTIQESYNRLAKKYEIIIMEGAGSPAEINLKQHDIVNMKMAAFVDAPVILTGDIDKGGVFAWLYGTLNLLTKKEKQRVKGLLINKFRGDKGLLTPGLTFIEKKTGKKILGVLPFFKNIKIPEEDTVALDTPKKIISDTNSSINIAVIRLPHISNFTDIDPLECEKDVVVKYVSYPHQLNDADIIIIPGTKNTLADFLWLKKTNLAAKIKSKINSAVLIGICGGFQMLGKKISDFCCIESNLKKTKGLGLLDMRTTFKNKKTTSQVKAKEITSQIRLNGYEIHHGKTDISSNLAPFCKIMRRNGRRVDIADGAKNQDGTIWGTYLHGIFDNAAFRHNFLNQIRKKKKIPLQSENSVFNQEAEFDKLAKLLKENIDIDFLYKILQKKV